MNIIDILRDCPEGTKLYSLVHGEVELTRVGAEDIYCKPNYLNHELSLYSDGRWVENQCECILFPSKENRDWSTFKKPFKDGDILFIKANYSWILIYKDSENKEDIYKYAAIPTRSNDNYIVYDDNPLCHKKDISNIRFATEEEKESLFKAIKDKGYRWNTETKKLEKLVEPKFNDGDVVFYSNTIAIFKEWGDATLFRTYCSLYTTVSNPTYKFEIGTPLFGKGIRREARFATEEEKESLFKAIRDNGHHWNDETKTLNKSVKFKIGDRVKKNEDYISGIVTEIFDDSFKVTYDGGACSYIQFHYQSDWKLVPDDTKFKIGDVIAHKTRYVKYRVTNFVDGSMYVLERCRDNSTYQMFVKYVDDDFELVPGDDDTPTLKLHTGDRVKHKQSEIYCTVEEYAEGLKGHYTSIGHVIPDNKIDEWEIVTDKDKVDKFDISFLKPFDKVLVRNDSSETWHIQFFENYNSQYGIKYPFTCMCNIKYSQCIPFKGNEHLSDKSDECDEYFKIWE